MSVRYVAIAEAEESRNGGRSEFISWPTPSRLILFVELNEKLAACKTM